MVAPVYETASTNQWSFYLPAGKWTDFFNGEEYEGGKTITGYDVSNYKFPVLVREGGIIPMYPESYYDNNRLQQKPRDPLTLDIFPSDNKITQFELLEDDGLTYRFKTDSMYNKTIIECDPTYRSDAVTIKIKGQYEGKGYEGMPEVRNYLLTIHGTKPQKVFVGTEELTEMKDITELEDRVDGWSFDSDKKVTHIKVKTQAANSSFNVYTVNGTP